MGLRRALALRRSVDELATAGLQVTIGGGDVAQVAHLPAEVAQAFGINTDTESIDRRTAMTIPAVRRGRQVIAGTIGGLPLYAHRGENAERVERSLFDQPDPNTTRQHVLTWLVDDLLFYGIAWWYVTETDATGYPTHVWRIPPTATRIDLNTGRVWVNGQEVPDDRLIRFDGPDEGVLVHGARTLRTTIALEEAVRRFARLDVPLGALRLRDGASELDGRPGTADDGSGRSQIEQLLDEWELARASRTTAYLNGALDYNVYALDAQRTQLAEARQHQAAEVARLLNLPPRYVNAPQASGMTYTSTESDRRDLHLTLEPYLLAVEQRLTMPDVTPRGQVARFDLTGLLRGDTLTALQAAEIGVRIGALQPVEVRREVLGKSGPAVAPTTAAGPALRPVPREA